MTAAWQPKAAYALGALVTPRASPSVTASPLTNTDFEAGASGWTLDAGWAINTSGPAYGGTYRGVKTFPSATTNYITNNLQPVVVPGQYLTVSGLMATVGAGATGRLVIEWQTVSSVMIRRDYSPLQTNSLGVWRLLTASGYAPATAAKVLIRFEGTVAVAGEEVRVDSASWNYSAVAIPGPLLYEATTAGTAALTEPAWPAVVGGTVVDGTVTWTARNAARVIWTAKPILLSGATQPTWPTTPGGMVIDGTISWQSVTRRVEDLLCPNSKVVTIAASHLFAGDGDITRFCAAVDPLDWTTSKDAGYLPTGLQMHGNNSVAVLNTYRANLVAFNAGSFQQWEVDEDPANNDLLDEMPGIGSVYQRAACPVNNDLFFLTPQGVRSVGIAAGSTNLQAGDIGMPVDALVHADVVEAVANGIEPIAFYYPGAGQFWLAMGTKVWVYTMNRIGAVGSWSRYVFPFQIQYQAQLDQDLYVRDGDAVRVITDTVNYDEMPTAGVSHTKVYYDGVVQWPWLDCGRIGKSKELAGFDIVCLRGTPSIQFGYDQVNQGTFTAAYTVAPDTMTDDIIAMPLTAPTLSPKITFAGGIGNFWELTQLNLYFVP